MEPDIELIELVYKNADMGVHSLTSLLRNIENKENKIKAVLEKELKSYEKYVSICEDELKENNVSIKTAGMMAKMSSDVGVMMETMKDNSDSALAQMVIEGITMGVVDITSKLLKYKSTCDQKVIKLTKNYLKFQEKEIEKLKEYL